MSSQWYVSPCGSPTNAGTRISPWSLAYAGMGADGRIKPGDTVWVRGGVYSSITGFDFRLSGADGSPITFEAYLSETVALDGSIPEFADPILRQAAWEPVGPTSAGHNLYRSTAVYQDHDFYGGFVQIDTDWYSLATHKNDLRYIGSDLHTWRFVEPQPGSGLEQPFYLGPGLCHNPVSPSGSTHGDGRLYVRLDNSSVQAQSNTLYAVPHAVAGTPGASVAIYETGTHYPACRFPERLKDMNTRALENPFTLDATGHALVFLNPGAYDISVGEAPMSTFSVGPDSSEPPARAVAQVGDPDPRHHALYIGRGDNYGLNISGSHLVFRNIPEINNFYGVWLMDPGVVDIVLENCGGRIFYFGGRCGSASRLKFDSCRVFAKMNGQKWWIAYGDIKGGDLPADHNRKCAIDLGIASDVEIVNCLFDEFFDGILSDGAHDVEVHGTTFNHIWDDAWQMYANLYDINYHHNLHYGSGPSRDSTFAGSPNPKPGSIFVHHNVVDTTTRLLYWVRWGRPEIALAEPVALSTHTNLKSYTWPWKFYYNTIVSGAARGGTYLDWTLLDATAPNSQTPHEVYNNILNVIDGRPVGRDVYANTGREIYDGNVYWHFQDDSPSTARSPWRIVHTSAGCIQDESLQTVVQLRASVAFTDSQAYYAPGWEASGLSVDPQLDGTYRPQSAPCRAGAVDLTGKGWPGTESYQPGRGAVAVT